MIERALLALVLVLGITTGLQTRRLADERTAHANTRTQAAEDRAAYDAERARVAVEFGKSVTQSLATQQELMAQAAQAQEEKHVQVSAARADADRLRDRLRAQSNQARSDPAIVPGATQAAPTVAALPSGAVLPGRVGDDLVSLALRADELRAEAQACYRAYDAARTALAAMKSPPAPE